MECCAGEDNVKDEAIAGEFAEYAITNGRDHYGRLKIYDLSIDQKSPFPHNRAIRLITSKEVEVMPGEPNQTIGFA